MLTILPSYSVSLKDLLAAIFTIVVDLRPEFLGLLPVDSPITAVFVHLKLSALITFLNLNVPVVA